MKKLIYILFFFPIFGMSQSSSFNALTPKKDLLIGDPVILTLKLEVSSSTNSDSIIFPDFNQKDTLSKGWEIWSVDTLQKITEQNNQSKFITTWTQRIQIASFDTGKVELIPIKAQIGKDSVFTNLISFNISALPIENDDNIKKIKAIKTDPITVIEKITNWFKNNWHILLSILIAICIVFFLIKKYLLNKDKKILGPLTPLPDLLLEQINVIESKKLWQNGKYKQYHSSLTDIIWKFIEYRYMVPTFEKTSDEIIQGIQIKNVPAEKIQQLKQLFLIADMVKFAKQIPTKEENLFVLDFIKKFITSERIDLKEKSINETSILTE